MSNILYMIPSLCKKYLLLYTLETPVKSGHLKLFSIFRKKKLLILGKYKNILLYLKTDKSQNKKRKEMKKIKIQELLNDQIRQIKNEIDWAVKLNNYAKAQELFFEMLKIEKKLK